MKGNWTYQQVDGFPDDKPLAQNTPPPVQPTQPTQPTQPASNPTPATDPVPKPVAKTNPPKVQEDPMSKALREQARQSGAMQADKTFIIDLNKMQPMKINPTGANPE
jgi:hypothetical protein